MKSATIGIVIMFAGYTIASYGIVLLKGWDISWKQWIDPLDPWQWSGTPQPVPSTQVFPSAASAGSSAFAGGYAPAAGAAALGAFGSQ
jgi:hypothetical protein